MHLHHGENHRPVPRVGQPHVQVRLIQVECKRRIEPAQRNQHITPDRNIGALGLDGAVRRASENLCTRHRLGFGLRIVINGPPFPLKADTVAPDHITTACCNSRVGKWRGQMGQPRWFRHRIIVDNHNDITSRHRDASVTGRTDVGGVKRDRFDLIAQGMIRHRRNARLISNNDNFKGR